jgi:hypothetical protein
MLWNYIIINQSYQYYDFLSILLFTLGLYYIINEKFTALLILFVIALFNKETIGYLVAAYLLFNYKNIFKWKIIRNAGLMVLCYIIIKAALAYIFRNNIGDNVQLCMDENNNVIKTVFTNRVIFKQVFLNFGGLYVFVFLLFLSGRWKKLPSRRKLFLCLAFLPNIFLGYFVTYFNEVRVYSEFIPLITTLFLIYISTFPKFNLQPLQED